MDLQDCLPAELRGTTTNITPIAAGLSGAGVYRVENGKTYVLKIGLAEQPIDEWRRALTIVRLVSEAGVAPKLVHADEARRAVVTEFVVNQMFLAKLMTPVTRAAAIAELGETFRRVHAIALPEGAEPRDPRSLLAMIQGWLNGFALPDFVVDSIARMQAEVAPPIERPAVMSHNDANPGNLMYDGEHLMLVDWDMAGANDPFYDLAALAVFLRFDDDACRALIAAHDGAPIDPGPLPARFGYLRRMVGVMTGSMFLHLARLAGHPGATGSETLEASLGLAELYARMREGSLGIHTPDGRWAFGLALHKAVAAL